MIRKLAVAAAVTLTAVVVLAVCGSLLMKAAPQSLPHGDMAVVEINVLHSLNGFWQLGSYSRFGWRHPGPLEFYALAPLYWISGEQSVSLPVAALLLNVTALAFVVFAARRYLPAGSTLAITIGVGALAVRADGLLSSIWNPHAVILPLAATMIASAVAAAGHPVLLVAVIAGASFIAQTHVGLAPAAVVLVAVSTIAVIGRVIGSRAKDPSSRRRGIRALIGASVLGLLLWAPPLIEQATSQQGNLGQIVSFFAAAERTHQRGAVAERIAGYDFAGLWRPGLTLAGGDVLSFQRSKTWLRLSEAELLALCGLLIAWRHRRRDVRWWLGLIVLLTAGVGYLAGTRVESPIPDHVLFWLGAVGAIAAGMLVGAALDSGVALMGGGARANQWLTWVPVAVLVLVAASGVEGLSRTALRSAAYPQATADIRTVSERVAVYLRSHPDGGSLVRISQSNWPIAAGIVLQLYKARQPIVIEPEWIVMFGEPFAPTGRERRELFLADSRAREALLKKRGATLIADTPSLSAIIFDPM